MSKNIKPRTFCDLCDLWCYEWDKCAPCAVEALEAEIRGSEMADSIADMETWRIEDDMNLRYERW